MKYTEKDSKDPIPVRMEYSLTKSVGKFSAATLISRISGLIREAVIAAVFGAGRVTDAFYVAFRIPNLLRDLFAENALSAAFVPVFTESLTKKSKENAFRLAYTTVNVLLIFVGGIVILGMVFAPYITKAIAYGFTEEAGKLQLTTTLTRLLFPFLLLISLAALCMGILNSFGKFFIPALAPTGFNLALIAAGFLIAPLMPKIGAEPIVAMAIGALIGGFLQIFIQLPQSLNSGLRYKPILDLKDPKFRKVISLFFPVTFGLVATKMNIAVNTFLASLLEEGSISYLTYAYRVYTLPLGLFGIAVSTVALQSFSKEAALADKSKLKDTLSRSLRLVLFLTIPASVVLIALSRPIIKLIYEHGEFTSAFTNATSDALILYSIGIFAVSTVKVLASCFYSLKDAKTPMRTSFLTVASNIALNLLLMRTLRFRAFALSASVAAIINATLLFFLIGKKIKLDKLQLCIYSIKVVIISIAMGWVQWLVHCKLEGVLQPEFLYQVIGLFVSISVGVITFSVLSKIFRIEEINLIGKIWRT